MIERLEPTIPITLALYAASPLWNSRAVCSPALASMKGDSQDQYPFGPEGSTVVNRVKVCHLLWYMWYVCKGMG